MQGEGVQVKPGDQVVIHGLKGRQDLNGKSAVLVGPAQNGRINVRLESGEQVALKQENLGIQAPGGSGMPGGGMGGGMPGFGGMGGMPGFGGMGGPGGMQMPDIQAMLSQADSQVRQVLAGLGLNVPASVSSQNLIIGLLVGSMLALYVLTRFFSTIAIIGAGFTWYWGSTLESGRAFLDKAASQISSVSRRTVNKKVLLAAMCIGVFFLAHVLLGGANQGASQGTTVSATSAASRDAAFEQAINEAYDQGYEHGKEGIEKRPPRHIPKPFTEPSEESAAKTSGGGMRSIMKYGMAGFYVYKLGIQQPGDSWNPQLAMTNAKNSPVQMLMMLVMLSGVLF